ncbi:MAG: hypothetical protein ACTSVI_00410 [Promethearchaeota archaeon]
MVLIIAFATVINQFGLNIFPKEVLDDIVFSKYHILFQYFKIQDEAILFLVIHDKNEYHYNIKKINQMIYWELKQKYSHLFVWDLFEMNELKERLNEYLDNIFIKDRRAERPIT